VRIPSQTRVRELIETRIKFNEIQNKLIKSAADQLKPGRDRRGRRGGGLIRRNQISPEETIRAEDLTEAQSELDTAVNRASANRSIRVNETPPTSISAKSPTSSQGDTIRGENFASQRLESIAPPQTGGSTRLLLNRSAKKGVKVKSDSTATSPSHSRFEAKNVINDLEKSCRTSYAPETTVERTIDNDESHIKLNKSSHANSVSIVTRRGALRRKTQIQKMVLDFDATLSHPLHGILYF
jgi:hypothetical protein